MGHKCCNVGCDKEASWWVLSDSDPPDMFMECCDDHLTEFCRMATHTSTVKSLTRSSDVVCEHCGGDVEDPIYNYVVCTECGKRGCYLCMDFPTYEHRQCSPKQ